MDFSGDKPGYGRNQIYLLLHYWWRVPVVGGEYKTQKVLLRQSFCLQWMVRGSSRVHPAVQDRKHITRLKKVSIQSVIQFQFRLNNLRFVFVNVLQWGDDIQRDGRDGHVLQTWRQPGLRHLWTRTQLRGLLLLQGSLPLPESWLQCLWQHTTVRGNHRRKWLGVVLKWEQQLQSQPGQRREQGLLLQPNLSKTTPKTVPVAALHCR